MMYEFVYVIYMNEFKYYIEKEVAVTYLYEDKKKFTPAVIEQGLPYFIAPTFHSQISACLS